ncbi:hypothetical protein FRC02_009874 [Tulasnella sp. 418]|nr:hypothetical protein FRC02_009874 [Tulasnella sp. 418]
MKTSRLAQLLIIVTAGTTVCAMPAQDPDGANQDAFDIPQLVDQTERLKSIKKEIASKYSDCNCDSLYLKAKTSVKKLVELGVVPTTEYQIDHGSTTQRMARRADISVYLSNSKDT